MLAELLRQAKLIVFDFDGTLVDSNPIKQRAFAQCFAEFPDRLDEIMAFCTGRHDLPRADKFRHVYEHILRRPYTAEISAEVHQRFEALTTQQIIDAPAIAGAEAFLRAACRHAPTALLSTTPHETLGQIIERRGWRSYFSIVQGAPVDKARWIMTRRTQLGFSRSQVVFFGDTPEDADAATAGGSVFIALGDTLRDGYDLALPDWRSALAACIDHGVLINADPAIALKRTITDQSVIDALLKHAETGTIPQAYISSHWRYHGSRTLVEQGARGLRLEADGFEVVSRMSWKGRALHTAERWSYLPVTSRLPHFPAIWRAARQLVHDLSGDPNFTVLSSVCVLALLEHHWRSHELFPKTFALIGDGHGFLGALIRRWLGRPIRVYCIDLSNVLIFQVQTHRLADPTARITLLSPERQDLSSDIICVLPHQIEAIPETIDCAINIRSMQEMNAFSIASYFSFLRRRSTPTSRFYCANVYNQKRLYGGDSVHFANYPWRPDDEMFVDEICPYFHHWFAPYTRPGGPKVLGVRLPFVNAFGSVAHRLVRLASQP